MIKFLQCEFFTYLKLIVLLIIINLIVKVIGADTYSKVIFLGSIIAVVSYTLLFILKFIRMIMSADRLKYQCTQGDTLKKALTWISNIV
jgi:sorbitol-specific phosphotransferase system component IIC